MSQAAESRSLRYTRGQEVLNRNGLGIVREDSFASRAVVYFLRCQGAVKALTTMAVNHETHPAMRGYLVEALRVVSEDSAFNENRRGAANAAVRGLTVPAGQRFGERGLPEAAMG